MKVKNDINNYLKKTVNQMLNNYYYILQVIKHKSPNQNLINISPNFDEYLNKYYQKNNSRIINYLFSSFKMHMFSILQNLIYIYSKYLHRKKHSYFLKFVSKLSKIKRTKYLCTCKKKIKIKNLKDYKIVYLFYLQRKENF